MAESKISQLTKELKAVKEENTSLKKLLAAVDDRKQDAETRREAAQAERDAIDKELRKAALLRIAAEDPETRAKTTWAVQQARAHGIMSLSLEMQGLAMRAVEFVPEWKEKWETELQKAHAGEHQRRFGK